MRKLRRCVLSLGLLVTLYGYLCRSFNLYFFWESKDIGWNLLVVYLILYLHKRIKTRNTLYRNGILEKIGIFIVSFYIVALPVILALMTTDDAYQAALDYLSDDATLKNEIGTVTGFSFVFTGSMQSISTNDHESGTANYTMTVKGEKRYKDVSIYLTKTDKSPWEVVFIK